METKRADQPSVNRMTFRGLFRVKPLDAILEDAEELQRYLLAAPQSTVDWTACESLHAAVVQVLLVARPLIRGAPSSAFLENHIGPLLRSDLTHSRRRTNS